MPKRKYQTPEILHDAPLTGKKSADFHFDDFAATLARLIANPNTETPLAIGINGSWGSGKTSLLLRVKNMLDFPTGEKGKDEHRFAEEKENFRDCKTIWFDAWKYNDEDKLLVALVRLILQAMQRDGLLNKLKAKLNNPTKKTYDVVAMFLNAFEASFGGLRFKLDMEKHAEISPFEKYAALFDYFDEAFGKLLQAWVKEGALVIFIDDLDRCLPAKTVQVLEAIKLFLDKSGCVFVLGADIKIVQAAVEAHYKNSDITGESAKDYLEKIIQIRFDIPPIVEKAMEGFLKTQEKTKVDEAMLKRWQALAAAAEVNPRRVKNVINDLNLLWFMAVNSGQAEGVNRDDFICWQALMRAAPATFSRQVAEFEDVERRHSFILDALKWQNGKAEDKEIVKGFFSAYEEKDAKRLRSVLKKISFSADFTPEALDSLIYMTAPPAKPEPVIEQEAQAAPEEKLIEGIADVQEPLQMRGDKGVTRTERNEREIAGMRFMRVPAGKFVMGSKEGSEFDYENERPQHTIDINYDYWMAKFILTNEQYAEFLGKNKHPVSDWQKKKDHPVVNVSWDDAMQYVKWFNEKYQTELSALPAPSLAVSLLQPPSSAAGNYVLRLPTEAEWEKAARGAYANEYPWGNEFDSKKCNSAEGKKGATTPVGAYSTFGDSPYGCADMVGNVWEWTHTLYKKYPYNPKDGREDETKRESRVLRGGSFGHSRNRARCASRSSRNFPDFRSDLVSFRLCVSSIIPL